MARKAKDSLLDAPQTKTSRATSVTSGDLLFFHLPGCIWLIYLGKELLR
jgi:hypothetical protein